MRWRLEWPGHQLPYYWLWKINNPLPSPREDFVHDDVIKWKHFPRYWPFVWGIPRWPGNSPHKGQWRGALMFSLTCAWINGWVNNRKAGDLRNPLWRHCNVGLFHLSIEKWLQVHFMCPKMQRNIVWYVIWRTCVAGRQDVISKTNLSLILYDVR